MARVNPFSLTPPTREVFTERFTDPAQPNAEIVLSLRRLDAIEGAAAVDRAESLKLKFLGDKEKEIEAEMPFPAIGGEIVSPTETAFLSASMLEKMQVEGGEGDCYSALEWVALSVTMPKAYDAITKFVKRVNKVPEKNGGGTAP